MAPVKQTVYLITDRQRDALVNYLQNQPFREVAVAIQFLINAPTAVLNVDAPDEQSSTTDNEPKPQISASLESIEVAAAT